MPHRKARLIYVYGKGGCKLCQSAREKLDAMKVVYIYRTLKDHSEPHDDWRQDGSVEAMAASAYIDGGLPVFVIDGTPYTYPQAMRLLRGREGKA